MALSDLAVFSEYTYEAMTEVIDQQIDKFNAASRGAVTLVKSAHQGDFSDKAFLRKFPGLFVVVTLTGPALLRRKLLSSLLTLWLKSPQVRRRLKWTLVSTNGFR